MRLRHFIDSITLPLVFSLSLTFWFSLVFLGGCASLPRIVPDLSRHTQPQVSLKGARGPLSAAQSKLILERLQNAAKRLPHPADPLDNATNNIFERHLALEEAIIGSPLTVGNEVVLLQDGPATYAAMLTAIAGAKDHINMETYILDDDAVGQKFATALIDRQKQGVQVNLIRDSAGTFSTPSAFFQALKDQGVNVLEFNPVNPLAARKTWALNQRDHRKLLIIDGRIAFVGGINISSVYSSGSFGSTSKTLPKRALPSPPAATGDIGASDEKKVTIEWRDTDLQLRGPVVAEFQKLFLATWKKQHGRPVAEKIYFPQLEIVGTQVVRAIGSAPEDPFSLIYATLISAINNAETSIYLTNAYFVPDPQLLSALKAAAQRGVDVKLILPSQTDSWLVFHAGRRYYSRLLRAGVKIYQRRGVILHSKTVLIDGVWATVGSTNLDWRSFLHNQEINAVVLGPEFGSQVKAMFAKDLAASDEITREQWRRRGLGLRIKEIFAQTWQYWL